MDALVSTEWLAGELSAEDLRIVDATYCPFDPARDPEADYVAGHLPGAVFLDLGGLADPATDLPGMVPPAGMFAERMTALGLATDQRIVLYDDSPNRTSPRAWWMLKLHGARQVAILDGGLAKWKAEGRPLGTGKEIGTGPGFAVAKDVATLRDLDAMRRNQEEGGAQVVDARSEARFSGAEADPRPGVAPGHIPGSVNLPYGRMFNPDGTWKQGDVLRAAFDAAGVDLDTPIIMTCGSGVTAAGLMFGAQLLGARDVALYDGSWSEWGADPTTDKAVTA